MWWKTAARFPARAAVFLFAVVKTRPHSCLCVMGEGICWSQHEYENLPYLVPKFNNTWSCISTPTYVFTAWWYTNFICYKRHSTTELQSYLHICTSAALWTIAKHVRLSLTCVAISLSRSQSGAETGRENTTNIGTDQCSKHTSWNNWAVSGLVRTSL